MNNIGLSQVQAFYPAAISDEGRTALYNSDELSFVELDHSKRNDPEITDKVYGLVNHGGEVFYAFNTLYELKEQITESRNPVYSVKEAAALLGVCKSRVRQLAHSRKLGITLGRIWIFTQADIEAMRTRKPGKPPIKGYPPG